MNIHLMPVGFLIPKSVTKAFPQLSWLFADLYNFRIKKSPITVIKLLTLRISQGFFGDLVIIAILPLFRVPTLRYQFDGPTSFKRIVTLWWILVIFFALVSTMKTSLNYQKALSGNFFHPHPYLPTTVLPIL